jgi:hypothetical protein
MTAIAAPPLGPSSTAVPTTDPTPTEPLDVAALLAESRP